MSCINDSKICFLDRINDMDSQSKIDLRTKMIKSVEQCQQSLHTKQDDIHIHVDKINELKELLRQQQIQFEQTAELLKLQIEQAQRQVDEYKSGVGIMSNLRTSNQNVHLHQGDYLRSENGSYYARIQSDGNFVVYTSPDWNSSHAVWASGTHGKHIGPYYLAMQTDGNLVIYGGSHHPIWASQTMGKGTGPPYYLEMQNDRNLVVYDNKNNPTWATMTNI
ncbi:unnamed protein product [Didymodactylos carnosus]|uniref:Bulb-type lectin domain-containing protein n=1 Tax=Didymodactylos carnosus TaxID=1234261 RepID=A0A8S2FCF3_9BILA|nr:unnamed protein product [Didymodactylos carnosus]CAF4223678.1 unnamed protein product [Didymodactylos carnosus]